MRKVGLEMKQTRKEISQGENMNLTLHDSKVMYQRVVHEHPNTRFGTV